MVQVTHVEEVKQLVATVLPGSNCIADAVTGVVAVGVVKEDLGGLSRLFQWLERSRRAKAAVREWGISNTTLEQVFLMLCVQNTEVNYVDPGRQASQNQQALCPMCRARLRASVVVRVWPPAAQAASTALDHKSNSVESEPLIALADSVCAECAAGNRHFLLTEEQALRAARDSSGAVMSALIEAARASSELAKSEALLAGYEAEAEMKLGDEEEDENDVRIGRGAEGGAQQQETERLLQPQQAPPPSPGPSQPPAQRNPYDSALRGSTTSQVD